MIHRHLASSLSLAILLTAFHLGCGPEAGQTNQNHGEGQNHGESQNNGEGQNQGANQNQGGNENQGTNQNQGGNENQGEQENQETPVVDGVLTWHTEPDALYEIGEPFTVVVAVDLQDSSIDPEDLEVTLELNHGAFLDATVGHTAIVEEENGEYLATFSDLLVGVGEDLRLIATAPGFASIESDLFDVVCPSAPDDQLAGAGTETSPYLICDLESFYLIETYLEDEAHFLLVSDLDFADQGPLRPLGYDSLDWFVGVFDGGGRELANIEMAAETNMGLFGWIGEQSVIKNLKLRNVHYQGALLEGFGALAATSFGDIQNVTLVGLDLQATVESESEAYIGGLVGHSLGTIEGSSVEGAIHITGSFPEAAIGGLVGAARGSVLGSSGDIDLFVSGGGAVGGLIGIAARGEFPLPPTSGEIAESFVTGTLVVDGTNVAGGLVGSSSRSISSSESAVTVEGNSGGLGGFGGVLNGATTQSLASGNVTATCDPDCSTTMAVGGFAGTSSNNLSHVSASGNVTLTCPGSCTNAVPVGGLLGRHLALSAPRTVYRCSATGDVQSAGKGGGLIGQVSIEAAPFLTIEESEIIESFATGSVTAEAAAGGLVGRLHALPSPFSTRSTISKSYATGNVIAYGTDGVAGGLVGIGPAILSESYAANGVTCDTTCTAANPLVGISQDLVASGLYYDADLYGSTPSGSHGEGLTTVDFGSEASFEEFDFTDTWVISTDSPARPILQWQIE